MSFSTNRPLQDFFARLRAAGVHHRWMWETRRDGQPPRQPRGAGKNSTYPDVGMVAFTGEGFQPAILIAIVIDYSNDGFGLFTEDGSHMIADDVARIVGSATKKEG